MTGEGVDALLAEIETRIAGALVTRSLIVPADRFADVAWLYDNAIVTERADHEDGSVTISARMTKQSAAVFDRRIANLPLAGTG